MDNKPPVSVEAEGANGIGEADSMQRPGYAAPGQEPSVRRRWVVVCMEAEDTRELGRLLENCAEHLIDCSFNGATPEPTRWLPSGHECMWAGVGGLPSNEEIAWLVERRVPHTD